MMEQQRGSDGSGSDGDGCGKQKGRENEWIIIGYWIPISEAAIA